MNIQVHIISSSQASITCHIHLSQDRTLQLHPNPGYGIHHQEQTVTNNHGLERRHTKLLLDSPKAQQ
jgi:hypothetical protein